MSTKICKLCGKEFEAKGNQAYCNRTHYRKCVICGELFELPKITPSKRMRSSKKTCSPECQTELGRRTVYAAWCSAMQKQGE